MKPRQVLVKRCYMGLGKITDPPYIITKKNFIPIRFMSAVRLIMSKVVFKTRKTKEISYHVFYTINLSMGIILIGMGLFLIIKKVR